MKSKYEPLELFLRNLPQGQQSISLSFQKIEEIIGASLPKSRDGPTVPGGEINVRQSNGRKPMLGYRPVFRSWLFGRVVALDRSSFGVPCRLVHSHSVGEIIRKH